jgi:hypothetical protein
MLRCLTFAIAAVLLISASYPGYAQVSGNRVTCTGTLVDVWLKPRDPWPLAVIYDEIGKYTCAIDRDNAGHDPLKPCPAGDRCRVTGTYRKHEGYNGNDPTYSIQLIDSIGRIQGQ